VKVENRTERLYKQEIYGEELKAILEAYHVNQYQKNIINKGDKVVASLRSDHQIAPLMIDNN